jgi:hypothetical protein
VIAQRLGLESDLILALSLLEGLGLTVAFMLLAERYLFSTTSVVSRPSVDQQAGAMAAAAGASRAARSRAQA